MFGSFGTQEIVLIALVVILLFGVGKFAGLGKDLGSSIKEFRRAVKDDDEEEAAKKAAALPPVSATQVQPPPPAQPTDKPKQNLF